MEASVSLVSERIKLIAMRNWLLVSIKVAISEVQPAL